MFRCEYSYKSGRRLGTSIAALPLIIGFAVLPLLAEAAPFAYVNSGAVIDTATNEIVGTLPVNGAGVAVSPDGKFVYMTNFAFGRGTGQVWAIDALTNNVTATTRAGDFPDAVAVSPDGKNVYATNDYEHGACTMGCTGGVFDISAATHKVSSFDGGVGYSYALAVAPNGCVYVVPYFSEVDNSISVLGPKPCGGSVTVGNVPSAVAISPDGKRAYVTNQADFTVSVVDTASLSVTATIPINDAGGPDGIAVAPDGSRAYVTTLGNNVWIIDTAKNAAVASVPICCGAGVAVAPDGKHVYVLSGSVYVIATATNKVVATIPASGTQIAIVPPPPGVPFLSFGAEAVIRFGSASNQDEFDLHCGFTLRSTESNGIDPLLDPVTAQVGTFTVTIPPRSFTKRGVDSFAYNGVIGGVRLHAQIRPAGALRYSVEVRARGASLAGSKNPIQVSLIIGNDSGTASIEAQNLAFAQQ